MLVLKSAPLWGREGLTLADFQQAFLDQPGID